MKDHRLRVLFPTKLHVEQHEADSIFEVVTRPNTVAKRLGKSYESTTPACIYSLRGSNVRRNNWKLWTE